MPAATLEAPPLPAVPTPKIELLETAASAAPANAAVVGMFYPLVLEFRPVIEMNDDQFFTFCQANRDLPMEQDANGKVIIMAPAGGGTGNYNIAVSAQVDRWAYADGTGVAFDSSQGFVLPSGVIRSPDTSWVLKTRLSALTADQKEKFLPVCPDFLLELRSPSDDLAPLKAKMEEYRQNGARLGWLIDTKNQQVFIYREGQTESETLDAPASLSGETVLPSFVMDMARIWTPPF